MSNYSSLFRVLSPSQVQTKFEENFLPSYIFKMKKVLTCFVMGRSLDGFTIVVAETISIDNGWIPIKDFTVGLLKKHIWKEISYDFDGSGIGPNRLNLWKAEIPVSKENRKILENPEIEYIKQTFSLKKLDPGNMFLDNEVFPDEYEPPQRHFHIIVQPLLPTTTGKRKLEEDEEDEFRAKKEKLKKISFHIPTGSLRGSLEILQQDEEKYQNLVNSLPNINTQDKVFKIPGLPGDIGDTYIYNRECYKYLCNFILEDTKFKRYLVTGNPGIGKTFFGRLMLTELLKKDKSVLLDYKTFTVWIHPSGEIYNVENKTLYRQMAEQPNVWCIIDGKRDQVGHDFSNGKLIMVSSPKKETVGDFAKQWCRKLYMPTWNENELEECWNILYNDHRKITLKSVKDKFKLCGGIARWIFSEESLLDIKLVIKQALPLVEPKMLSNQAKDFIGDEYTHKLIHTHTNLEKTDEAEPYTSSFCFFASDYVARECLKKLKDDYKKHLRTFIEGARDIPEMGSLRGQLFELVSHEILRRGGVFPVRKLTNNSILGYETTLNLQSLEEISFDNVGEIEENIGQGIYYRPTSKIFETIDSYVHYNKLFQVTVAKSHGIKQEGLRAIKGILDLSCRINFYFVLPKDVFTTFTKEQKYQNTGRGIIIDEWITENIDQYALCIDLDQYSF